MNLLCEFAVEYENEAVLYLDWLKSNNQKNPTLVFENYPGGCGGRWCVYVGDSE